MFFHECIKFSLAFFFFFFYKKTVFPSSFLSLGRTWCVNCDTCQYMTIIPWTTMTQKQQSTQQRKTRRCLYGRNNKDFTLRVSVVCSLSVVQFFFFFYKTPRYFCLLKILSNKNSISPPYFHCSYRAFKLEQEEKRHPKTDFQLLKLMVR